MIRAVTLPCHAETLTGRPTRNNVHLFGANDSSEVRPEGTL